jgi:hypothetical protein
MPAVPRHLIEHSLNVSKTARPIKQKLRLYLIQYMYMRCQRRPNVLRLFFYREWSGGSWSSHRRVFNPSQQDARLVQTIAISQKEASCKQRTLLALYVTASIVITLVISPFDLVDSVEFVNKVYYQGLSSVLSVLEFVYTFIGTARVRASENPLLVSCVHTGAALPGHCSPALAFRTPTWWPAPPGRHPRRDRSCPPPAFPRTSNVQYMIYF